MLAIIIPYFKINFFEETLQSLANQTDNRFKVYIGDDQSPDSPVDLLEKYKGVFNFKYHKFQNNLGSTSLTRQWQRCIDLSSYEEWIIILGDDDLVSNNIVELFYANYGKFKNLTPVVRFATYKIDASSKIYSKLFTNQELEHSTKIIENKKRSSLSEYAFRKDIIDIIKFKDFPLAWYSDLLAVLEFSNFGQIFSINSAYVKIRISEESISGMKDNFAQKEEAKFQFYNYILKNANQKINKETTKIVEGKLNNIYFNDKKFFKRFIIIFILYLKKHKFRSIFNLFHSLFTNIQK